MAKEISQAELEEKLEDWLDKVKEFDELRLGMNYLESLENSKYNVKYFKEKLNQKIMNYH